MPDQRITMAMVASAAGVSLPTVSKVLNGRTDVSARTRARVESVIQEYGYQHRPTTARPAAQLIELVFHELESPWAVELLRGVEAAASAEGVGVVVSDLATAHTPSAAWMDAMLARRPAALVLVLVELSADQRARLASRNLPYVMVEPVNEVDSSVPTVGSSNWLGGRAATMHLIELGHRRIGVIGGPLSTQSSRIRVDGYRDALLTSGIAVDPELITHGDFHVNSGYELGRHLLTLPHPPTAIFAGSDLQAMGVLRAARELNIAVPEQLSVVGYDDLPMAAWLTPALTTVHQPLFEMAETAAHIALQLARGQEPPARRLDLSVGLVVRQSTAPAVS